MNPPSPFPFDLQKRARQAMQENGFEPDFPTDAYQQALQAEQHAPAIAADAGIQDLRGLLWSSIDNRESRDLDQIEVAETLPNGAIRVLVGIADVDALAPAGTPVDRHAAFNTSSIYTGAVIFPMLPGPLSTDASSLIEADRLAVVTEMTIEPDGAISAHRIYRARVHNRARLDYDSVGEWLEGHAEMPAGIARAAGMEAQLHLQAEAAQRLLTRRQQAGALDFESIEAEPVVQDGKVVDLAVPQKNRARQIIENLMIAANTTMAGHLEGMGLPSLQRVVREPERWPRIVDVAAQYGAKLPSEPDARALADFLAQRKAADPAHFPDLSLVIVKLMGPGEYVVVKQGDEEGHFALATYRYTHSTAPNRRFVDLVLQRIVKCALAEKKPPYPTEDLENIAIHCTEREHAARKVERTMRKAAAALFFHDHIGEVFDAYVTGCSPKGTYVRVVHPPVEGRVVQGEAGMDVGDRVRVKLVATDPWRGFIDFAAA